MRLTSIIVLLLAAAAVFAITHDGWLMRVLETSAAPLTETLASPASSTFPANWSSSGYGRARRAHSRGHKIKRLY